MIIFLYILCIQFGLTVGWRFNLVCPVEACASGPTILVVGLSAGQTLSMKEIPLTRGFVATVDDDDYERAVQFNWTAACCMHKWYARRAIGSYERNGKRGSICEYMHHFILGKNVLTDHRDNNGLNNCKSNLRPCTHSQNHGNQSKMKNNTSGYKGVWKSKGEKKWSATIRAGGKTKYLGRFDDKMNAARAYDAAAILAYGEFALLNFPVNKVINA